jgi:hypothetical protein
MDDAGPDRHDGDYAAIIPDGSTVSDAATGTTAQAAGPPDDTTSSPLSMCAGIPAPSKLHLSFGAGGGLLGVIMTLRLWNQCFWEDMYTPLVFSLACALGFLLGTAVVYYLLPQPHMALSVRARIIMEGWVILAIFSQAFNSIVWQAGVTVFFAGKVWNGVSTAMFVTLLYPFCQYHHQQHPVQNLPPIEMPAADVGVQPSRGLADSGPCLGGDHIILSRSAQRTYSNPWQFKQMCSGSPMQGRHEFRTHNDGLLLGQLTSDVLCSHIHHRAPRRTRLGLVAV